MLQQHTGTFYGWRVVGAAGVLAGLGWGIGFYGPPVFLREVGESTGWPLALISTAITCHFLIGALISAWLPQLHGRFGAATVTKAAVSSLSLGVLGWGLASAPWQLFVASVLSGAGWGATSASAINALIAPWFVRARPAALAMAYNGASIGGVLFSPLWAAAIGAMGFPGAAAVLGLVATFTIWLLADRVFARSPQAMGLLPDGEAPGTPRVSISLATARPLPGALLWRDIGFLTLAAAMALGLFAQIGLISHLYSLLVPRLGAQPAGLAMGLITLMAIAGRTLLGWVMPTSTDRRTLACANYTVQLTGSLTFLAAAGTDVPLLLLAVMLFGTGFGNATSFPPLIAQAEFVDADVPRVVALIVAISQASYSFAPAVFGVIRELAPQATAPGAAPGLFLAAALLQLAAILVILAGRRR